MTQVGEALKTTGIAHLQALRLSSAIALPNLSNSGAHISVSFVWP